MLSRTMTMKYVFVVDLFGDYVTANAPSRKYDTCNIFLCKHIQENESNIENLSELRHI